ncbi:hypothetical protein RvY_02517 [Ramazzottius varieornatus]|uniref:Uncharacterized protein n=1 Tax=Ramazzottius varieornatus TaxID=947166 RepID=A0A1D1UK08_RAMVA|nr:hypothetical protein RvY_02517 [Ramazzottius varieornatus]
MSVPAAHRKSPSSSSSAKKVDFSKSSPEIQRFVYYQQVALEDCARRIGEQEVLKKTYLDLRARLSMIAEQTRYPSTVPLGPHALVHGELVHTNEILVLLGDGYFVERTAKQACEIADRRIIAVDGILRKLDEERKIVQNKLDMLSTMIRQQGIEEDIVEIRETVDQNATQEFSPGRTANVPKKFPTDHEIAQRLDQLEKEEMEEDEEATSPMHKSQSISDEMDDSAEPQLFLRPIPNLSDRPRRSSLPSATPGKAKKERKSVTFAPFEGAVPERERSINPMFKQALQKMLASGKFRTMDESSSEFEYDDPPPPRSFSSDNVPRLKKQGHIAMDSIEDSLDVVEPADPPPVTDTDVIIERNLADVSTDAVGESLLTSPTEDVSKTVSRFKANRQRDK